MIIIGGGQVGEPKRFLRLLTWGGRKIGSDRIRRRRRGKGEETNVKKQSGTGSGKGNPCASNLFRRVGRRRRELTGTDMWVNSWGPHVRCPSILQRQPLAAPAAAAGVWTGPAGRVLSHS